MAPFSIAPARDMGPVVIVTPWFPNTPEARTAAYVYESAAALAGRGVEVHVLVCRPWLPQRVRMQAPEWMRGDIDSGAFTALASVTSIRYPSLPRGVLRPFTNVWLDQRVRPAAERIVRDTKARIVHAHTEGLAPVAAPLSAKCGCRSVVTLHGLNTDPKFLHSGRQRRRLRDALNKVDRLVLVGEPLRDFFCQFVGRDDHFRVIHNGLKIDAIPPRRDELLRKGAPTRFISVSYLHEGKGIDITLRALALLRDQGLENWTYTIVGDGYQAAELIALVDRMRLSRQVTFAGGQPREKVFEMLVESDVFVLPSYREAFGIAWLEAMAAGLVTIGVRGEGPSTFIESTRNGFLVEPKDPEALANLLRHVTENPERMQEIGTAAKQTVRGGFTWDAHADTLLACYAEMLQKDRVAAALETVH